MRKILKIYVSFREKLVTDRLVNRWADKPTRLSEKKGGKPLAI